MLAVAPGTTVCRKKALPSALLTTCLMSGLPVVEREFSHCYDTDFPLDNRTPKVHVILPSIWKKLWAYQYQNAYQQVASSVLPGPKTQNQNQNPTQPKPSQTKTKTLARPQCLALENRQPPDTDVSPYLAQ